MAAGDPKAAGSDTSLIEIEAAEAGVDTPEDEATFVASRDDDPIPPREGRISVAVCGDSDAEGAAED